MYLKHPKIWNAAMFNISPVTCNMYYINLYINLIFSDKKLYCVGFS